MTQKARPAADVSNDGWSPTPVYAQVDEAVPDDNDFVTASPCGAEFVVRLARLAPPVVGPEEPAHELTVRLAGPAYVTVELLQGSTLIAWDTFTPGPGFADYTLTLTREEAAKIRYQPGPNGDPDLRVRVTAVEGSGSGLGGCVACLQRLCVTRDAGGYVTGVFYTDDDGTLIEVLSCTSGSFAEDPACVACLERLCVTRDDVAITGVFYTDDDGTLIEVPGCPCVTTCPQCDTPSMSRSWTVAFDGQPVVVVDFVENPDDGNHCRFLSADGKWDLRYESGEEVWVLTNLEDERVWVIAEGDWSCTGENVLQPADEGESNAVVVPVTDCPPHVEPCNDCSNAVPLDLGSEVNGITPATTGYCYWILPTLPNGTYHVSITDLPPASAVLVTVLSGTNCPGNFIENSSRSEGCFSFTVPASAPVLWVTLSVESSSGFNQPFSFTVESGPCP